MRRKEGKRIPSVVPVGESDSVKMVGEESESKKKIKIHERFERRRIKIHDGIIAGPSKTKARDSS